jgi:hypothetical protein
MKEKLKEKQRLRTIRYSRTEGENKAANAASRPWSEFSCTVLDATVFGKQRSSPQVVINKMSHRSPLLVFG